MGYNKIRRKNMNNKKLLAMALLMGGAANAMRKRLENNTNMEQYTPGFTKQTAHGSNVNDPNTSIKDDDSSSLFSQDNDADRKKGVQKPQQSKPSAFSPKVFQPDFQQKDRDGVSAGTVKKPSHTTPGGDSDAAFEKAMDKVNEMHAILKEHMQKKFLAQENKAAQLQGTLDQSKVAMEQAIAEKTQIEEKAKEMEVALANAKKELVDLEAKTKKAWGRASKDREKYVNVMNVANRVSRAQDTEEWNKEYEVLRGMVETRDTERGQKSANIKAIKKQLKSQKRFLEDDDIRNAVPIKEGALDAVNEMDERLKRKYGTDLEDYYTSSDAEEKEEWSNIKTALRQLESFDKPDRAGDVVGAVTQLAKVVKSDNIKKLPSNAPNQLQGYVEQVKATEQ